MRFIDRVVADSRQVALNHTAGLSLPQQMQMTLFALYSIIDKREGDNFRQAMLEIIDKRLNKLWENMGFTLVDDPLRAGYYSEIDLTVWGKRFYGEDFVDWLRLNHSPLDVVFRLATETSLVVLNGGGFDGPDCPLTVREGRSWLSRLAHDRTLTTTLPEEALPAAPTALELKNLWFRGNYNKSIYNQLKAGLPNTRIAFDYGTATDGGWRELQNYFDMRDLLGMHYMQAS